MQRPSSLLAAVLLAAAFSCPGLDAQERLPRGVPGEPLPESAITPLVRETMDIVLERERERPRDDRIHGVWNGEDGRWFVPPEGARTPAHSGERAVVNEWGDPRMGIGFGGRVDVAEVWAAGHGAAPAAAVRFVGYRSGEEAEATEWTELGSTMQRFELGFEDVDRLEIRLQPAVERQGWIALDDLAFETSGGRERVLDFEDLPARFVLTGSGYAGLQWERGYGFHLEDGDIVPAPRTRDADREVVPETSPPSAASRMAGTAPVMWQNRDTVRMGEPGANLIPPDTCGASGPDHYVAIVNSNISGYRISDGNRLFGTSLLSFWPGSTGTVGDPRAVFDPHSQRFVVMATNFSRSSTVYVAVSASADPTGAWFKFSFRTDRGPDRGKWPDYPTLGVDARGVYIAAFMVGGTNGMTVWAIDKAPLLASPPSMGTISAWRNLPWEGAIQPCTTYGDPGSEYLVSRASSTSLRLRQVVPPLTAPHLLETGFVSVPAHSSPPLAPAAGSRTPINTIDSRPLNAVFRNGSVWTTHGVRSGGRSACRWYELTTSPPGLAQVGTIDDPVWYYYYPSIAVDAANNVAIGFSGSHVDSFAGAFVTGRHAGDPPGTTAPPVLYKEGEGPWNHLDSAGRNRFGDYSHTTVDAVDDVGFWTIQQYVLPGNQWGTRLARVGYEALEYGVGLAGTTGVPSLGAAARPVIGRTLTLDITNSVGAGPTSAVLLAGTGKLSQPLLGGTLLVSPLAVHAFSLPAPGGSVPVPIPQSSTVVGVPVYFQVGQTDAGAAFGLSLTPGLEVRAGSR